MAYKVIEPETRKLVCNKCQQELVLAEAEASYLGAKFEIELMKCPKCGLVYVPGSLATGKMEQVELSREDK
jgi:uncharacterized protein with PIN domain